MPRRVRRFFSELKRRHVFRVLIGYTIAAWLLIQVAETTFPYLGLPDRAVTLVIWLAIAGVPAAAVFSWIFDLTVGGPEVTDAEPQPTRAPQIPSSAPVPRLPLPAGALIGRQAEADEGCTLLIRADVRLLTITGTGGTGKTRLALELAHRAAASFADGARWVALGAVADPGLVPSAIGQALGIGEAGTEGLPERLRDELAGRELLLVLDSFEHLLPAASTVADLLADCPGLTVLVTTRAPLRVRGEREFPLASLAVPDPGDPPDALRDAPAVRLFGERAREVEPSFQLTEHNLPAVAEICRALDGLPLAIELAAVRVKLLGPEAILARLDHRLSLLTGGARDMPARHRTLREAIAWSHDLLSAPEQRLLHRLSVFAGGWDLDAAEAVCAADEGESATLDLLQALVDHSLVRRSDLGNGDSRLSMLETIREFALERLAGSGEERTVRARHLEHFTTMAEAAEPQLVGPRQSEWLERLELEHDNLRAALAWSLSADHEEEGLRLATALWRLWEVRGHLSEGRRWLDLLLASREPAPGKLRLKGLYAAGILADAQADYEAAEARFRESLELNRALGDRWGVANALNNVGVMALRRGDYASAHALYEESVSLWQELGNDAAIALALNNLGNVARLRGEHAEARRLLEESLAMHRARGDRNGCALALGLLGDVAGAQGDREGARKLYEESLELFRQAGNASQVARSLLELARLCMETDTAVARARCGESLRLAAELGNPRAVADALDVLSEVAAAEGHEAPAARFSDAATAMRERPGGRSPHEASAVRDALAWVAGTRGSA